MALQAGAGLAGQGSAPPGGDFGWCRQARVRL